MQKAGQNSLGKILMAIRDEYKKNIENEKWLQDQPLETDPELFPKVSLIVSKEGKNIDKLFL